MLHAMRRAVGAVPGVKVLHNRLLTIFYRHIISNHKFISKRYQLKFGKKPNLTHPQSFNEKLQWMKLRWRDSRAVQCADKHTVREFVADKIGTSYLIENYGVYRHVEQIDLHVLPKSFVFKATHGSGWNILCKDKTLINWDNAFKQMRHWLRSNYYYCGREWVYKNIVPRIICEKYLQTEYGQSPSDYKFFCFNGKPEVIQVDLNRFSDHRRNMYDTKWNRLPFALEYPTAPDEVRRPCTLEKMLDVASRLSAGFPFVRVDLYEANAHVYFGEMTFYPECGTGRFEPIAYDERLGELFHLPGAM